MDDPKKHNDKCNYLLEIVCLFLYGWGRWSCKSMSGELMALFLQDQLGHYKDTSFILLGHER